MEDTNIPFPDDDVSSISDYGASYNDNETAPYLTPLRPVDDKYDVYDLELILLDKKVEIHARHRISQTSSGRPTYKIQKTLNTHLFGKKNMTVSVNRNEGWDATKAEPFPANRDRDRKTLGYVPVFTGQDQSSRHLTLSATRHTVLSPFAGRIAMTPCPSGTGIRESTCHHFFTLGSDTTQKKKPHAVYGASPTVAQNTIDSGYFVFDCNSQKSRDLLTSLYHTGYENRPRVRKSDPLIAELRLQTPVLEPAKARIPAWKRLFQDRHANLHISRRGVEMCFMGSQSGVSLTQGQAQEIVLASVAMAILSIEHDGIDGKRWGWMLQSRMIGSPMPGSLTVQQALTRQQSVLPFEKEEKGSADLHSFVGPTPSYAPSVSSFSPTSPPASALPSPTSPPPSVFSDSTGVHSYANSQVLENGSSRARDIERDSILSSGTRSLRSVERHHVAGGFTLTKKSSLAISITASIESVEWREGTRMVSQQQQLAVEEFPEVDVYRKSPLDELTELVV